MTSVVINLYFSPADVQLYLFAMTDCQTATICGKVKGCLPAKHIFIVGCHLIIAFQLDGSKIGGGVKTVGSSVCRKPRQQSTKSAMPPPDSYVHEVHIPMPLLLHLLPHKSTDGGIAGFGRTCHRHILPQYNADMHTGKKTIHLPEPITHFGLHGRKRAACGKK